MAMARDPEPHQESATLEAQPPSAGIATSAGTSSTERAVLRAYAAPDTLWDWRQLGAMLLGDVADKDVLAFGCEGGDEALCLAQLGARVTVIDFSDVAIARLKRVVEHHRLEIRALQMRCDPTSFPDESFDRVHGIGILGRAGADPALAEVRRLLRPHGRGVFLERIGDCTGEDDVPLTWAELGAATLRFASAALYPYHLTSRLHRFVPGSLRDMARRFDFALLAVAPGLRRFAGAAVIRVIK